MHPREKARLFEDLGQLVRSGTPFPKAIEVLLQHTRGAANSALLALKTALDRGATVAGALAAGAPAIAPLECGIFTASDRAGRLENGLSHAAEYYGSLSEARSRMWSRAAYPLFVLHFGFIALSLPIAFAADGGIGAFLKSVGMAVACLWAGIALGSLLLRSLTSAGERSAALDRMLRSIPVFGKIRRNFSLGRFCAAYNLQLDAGVNVLASLDIAGTASSSAVIRGATAAALPAVRAGGKVGAALTATGVFPERFIRAFAVGEETGQLDQELRRLADECRLSALRRLETVSEWIPKLLFIAIVIYLAFGIFGFYRGQLQQLQDVMKD